MIPDPDTAKIDPFYATPTLSLICSIFDPITKQPYSRDPRHIAKKAEAYLRQTGIADTSFMGPEAEFFVFDDVRFDQSQPNAGYYYLDSNEGAWNSGREEFPNLGYKTRHKEGYFPVPPTDTLADLRQAIMTTLMETGIEVEVGHHEVASGGQCEIGMKFNRLLPVRRPAHVVQVRREERRAQARQDGDVHAEAALRRQRQRDARAPVALEGGQAPLRRRRLRGPQSTRRSTTSAASSSTRSRSRRSPTRRRTRTGASCPGFEAPVNLAYSSRNRSASVPHPHHGAEPEDAPHRGPLPGPELQPVPRLQRDADGGARRHPEQDQPGRPDGQGHLRPVARGAEGRPADAGQPRGGARRRSSATTSSCSAATSSRRTPSTSGSTSSGRRSSTRSGCGRRRTSSISTSTSESPSCAWGAR